jgi:hypothetical protein
VVVTTSLVAPVGATSVGLISVGGADIVKPELELDPLDPEPSCESVVVAFELRIH